jgi:hypothetical protein
LKVVDKRVVGGLLAAIVGALVLGCNTNPDPVTVFCTDFSVGADLSSKSFGVSGEAEKPYVAFAQAVSDMAIMGSTLLDEVESSCRDLALTLGANESDGRLVGVASPARARVWCDIAAEKIRTKRAMLRSANLSLWFTTPGCVTDTEYQASCEARCRTDVACVESSIVDRCAPADVVGSCNGKCTGKCSGAEDAPSSCDGECSGTCEGDCLDGRVSVPDFESGTSCPARCVGKCNAVCVFAADSRGSCDAPCRGGCEGTLSAPSCVGDLAPPRCTGDADCQKCCKASAAARASCDGGALGVSVADGATVDRAVAEAVQSFERNLPTIFLTARGRGESLRKNASALVDTAGRLLAHDDIGQMGAACGLLMAQTGEAASDNVKAALEGAKKVATAIDETTAP